MKFFVLNIFLLVLGCKSITKSSNTAMKDIKPDTEEVFSCPENGTCSWTLMANTSLTLKEDTIGALYPVFDPKEGMNVIQFKYNKTVDSKMADGSYSEIVLIEIDDNISSLELKDEELQKVKLTYARLCFCRGQSGYFPVTKGILKLSKEGGGYQAKLNFENGKIPQIIKTIEGLANSEHIENSVKE